MATERHRVARPVQLNEDSLAHHTVRRVQVEEQGLRDGQVEMTGRGQANHRA